MLQHRALLDSDSLDPSLIVMIQLSEEEEKRMGVVDELVTDFRAKHPRLFPEGEALTMIEAKAQDTGWVSKKWCR